MLERSARPYTDASPILSDATGDGYWVVTSSGNVYAFGDAGYFGAPGLQSSPMTSAVATPDGKGYWILEGNGHVFGYGDAPEWDSPNATNFNGPTPRTRYSRPSTALVIGWPMPGRRVHLQ
jgi:hypothetical protein